MKAKRIDEIWGGWLGQLIVVTIFVGLALTAAGAWPWVVGWLNSPNASGWMQAIGAIVAVIAAGQIASYQVRKQREIATASHKIAIIISQKASLVALLNLCNGIRGSMEIAIGELEQWADVCKKAKDQWWDYRGYGKVEAQLDAFPFLELPSDLPSVPLEVALAVNQFRVDLERMQQIALSGDPAQYPRTLERMKSSLEDVESARLRLSRRYDQQMNWLPSDYH